MPQFTEINIHDVTYVPIEPDDPHQFYVSSRSKQRMCLVWLKSESGPAIHTYCGRLLSVEHYTHRLCKTRIDGWVICSSCSYIRDTITRVACAVESNMQRLVDAANDRASAAEDRAANGPPVDDHRLVVVNDERYEVLSAFIADNADDLTKDEISSLRNIDLGTVVVLGGGAVAETTVRLARSDDDDLTDKPIVVGPPEDVLVEFTDTPGEMRQVDAPTENAAQSDEDVPEDVELSKVVVMRPGEAYEIDLGGCTLIVRCLDREPSAREDPVCHRCCHRCPGYKRCDTCGSAPMKAGDMLCVRCDLETEAAFAALEFVRKHLTDVRTLLTLARAVFLAQSAITPAEVEKTSEDVKSVSAAVGAKDQ